MIFSDFYSGKEIILLGGTGSLGNALVHKIKDLKLPVKGIRIFSRDEYKQWCMAKSLGDKSKDVSFLIGDVRDVNRLKRAFAGVDIVVNCAAMKHVGACELNPIEAVQTNIDGAKNIIEAALDCNVGNVLHVSTDKAVYPVNLYGATKTVAEKLFLDASIYRGSNYRTAFACVRYGNVFGSRGSLVELILKDKNPIPITDKRMTRFFITLDQVTDFIIDRIAKMESGNIYVPEMKSIEITKLIDILSPGRETFEIGIQPGEKLHECIMSKDEYSKSSLETYHFGLCYCVGRKRVFDINDSHDITSENSERLSEDTILHWREKHEI